MGRRCDEREIRICINNRMEGERRDGSMEGEGEGKNRCWKGKGRREA